MFYQLESLKKGGRFYMCWLADSYPEGFKKISYRQLWTQDVNEICDDLHQVMMSEAGHPVERYSLRLSSQLLRGLVRLYHKKVCSFLSHLYSLEAKIFKDTNKKWAIDEERQGPVAKVVPLQINVLTTAAAFHDEPENEERVEEIIQQSGNVVSNIQNITLKESTMVEHQVPIDDGFGEEHPEQALQLLTDRTLESMLLQPGGEGAQLSGLGLALPADAGGHDESRLAPPPPPAHAAMERISDHDVRMRDQSIGQAILHEDFEKEIPRTPEILHPEMPAPEPDDELLMERQKENEIPEPSVFVEVQEPSKEREPDIELEELEEISPPAKRRRRNKLIIDKRIKLSSEMLRARLQNPNVELRCEESSMDIVDLGLPWDLLLRRAAHAGSRLPSSMGFQLAQLFVRNLTYTTARTADRELEEALYMGPRQSHSRVVPERNEEMDESVLAPPPVPVPESVTAPPVEEAAPEESLLDAITSRHSVPEEDISLLPTQIIETLSQKKRRLADDADASPKKQRCQGIKTFQKKGQKKDIEIPVLVIDEASKENVVPEEYQQAPPVQKRITNLLQMAGIADIQTNKQSDQQVAASDATARKSDRRSGSDRSGSETPLGSLDRTRVSLGDSDKITDLMKFLRDHWGTEGTMLKIMDMINHDEKPVTVETLVAKGPVIAGQKKIIAARCFISILKLKQHGFINIVKNAGLAIQDITLTETITF